MTRLSLATSLYMSYSKFTFGPSRLVLVGKNRNFISIAVGTEPSHAISNTEMSISYRMKLTMSKSVEPSDLYACTTAADFDQKLGTRALREVFST